MSRLYFFQKINNCYPVLPVFLEQSEYKLCWAHKSYFSHIHRILGTIAPSNKRVCLFSNEFRKCIHVFQMIQRILSQDIHCRYFLNAKNLGTVSQPLKTCIPGRLDAMSQCFSAVFWMDRLNNMSPIHFWVTYIKVAARRRLRHHI